MRDRLQLVLETFYKASVRGSPTRFEPSSGAQLIRKSRSDLFSLAAVGKQARPEVKGQRPPPIIAFNATPISSNPFFTDGRV